MPSQGPKDRKHSNGHDKSTRESRVSLAAYLRERFPAVVMADMYEVVLMRKMPKVVKLTKIPGREDEECHPGCNCGLTVEIDEFALPPTIDHMMLVLSRIMERSYGLPGQHLHIEAELRAEVTAIAGGVDPRYLQKLSPQALLAIKNAVKGLPATTEKDPEPPIDAEFVDMPSTGDE